MKSNEHLEQQSASLTHKDKLELLARELAEATYPTGGEVPTLRAYETANEFERLVILRRFAAANARHRELGQPGVPWPETHEEFLRIKRLQREDTEPEPRGFYDRTDGWADGGPTGGHEPWESGT